MGGVAFCKGVPNKEKQISILEKRGVFPVSLIVRRWPSASRGPSATHILGFLLNPKSTIQRTKKRLMALVICLRDLSCLFTFAICHYYRKIPVIVPSNFEANPMLVPGY